MPNGGVGNNDTLGAPFPTSGNLANPISEPDTPITKVHYRMSPAQNDQTTDGASSRQLPASCAECRRLKLKCDREVPCSSCVRRHCEEICPDGVKPARRAAKDEKEFQRLQQRIQTLESELVKRDPSNTPLPSRERPAPYTRSPLDSHRSRASSRSKSPPHWDFNRSLLESTRIPTPPSYRYHEDSSRSNMGQVSALGTTPRAAPANPLRHETYSETAGGSGTQEQVEGEHSHGTLVIDRAGRSRYFGATAGTEWLKNQEIDGEATPWKSQSPRQPAGLLPNSNSPRSRARRSDQFPFASAHMSLEQTLNELPPLDEARTLVESYYRYYAWNHDVAPRTNFQPIFDRAYATRAKANLPDEEGLHLQQIALIFAILAVGTHHNLEIPSDDSGSEEFVGLAKACLTADDFLNHNTIAGIQTIVILGHYCLETEKGRTGDAAWPLWGIASRMLIAMGLHRDGEKWNLPSAVVQERRQVFWETQTIDCLQANCFSRPGPLGLKHIDTAFPDPEEGDAPPGVDNFFSFKYHVSRFSARIIDEGNTTGRRSYSNVTSLYQELCELEKNIPFHLRCRTALISLPSVYPDPEQARLDSPDISRRNLKRTLQQFTLSLNVSETILSLQRPYFVMALKEEAPDPTQTIYGHSYLVVVERCNAIIQIVATLFELHPACLSRHWFFWYHLFTAAVCLGTLVLNHPHNVLSEFARGQIDLAIACYSSLLRGTTSKTLLQNHDWLVRLRDRCASEVSRLPGTHALDGTSSARHAEDAELLGWRTRLIERAATGGHKATSIVSGESTRLLANMNMEPSDRNQGMLPTVNQVLQQHYMPAAPTSYVPRENDTPAEFSFENDPTDMLMHQFWDPLLGTGDASPSANWWNWTSGPA